MAIPEEERQWYRGEEKREGEMEGWERRMEKVKERGMREESEALTKEMGQD